MSSSTSDSNHQSLQNSCPAITSENSPVHGKAPKEMETQKNNSIIDLGKLLSGEKKSIKFNRQGNVRLSKEPPCSLER